MVVYASKHYNYNYLNLSLLFFELVQVREEALLQCGFDTTTVQTVIYQFSLQILRFHFLYPDTLRVVELPLSLHCFLRLILDQIMLLLEELGKGLG